MSHIKIPENSAKETLNRAYNTASDDEAVKTLKDAYDRANIDDLHIEAKARRLIDFVLGNTHKTYKYILVTALLAKATEPGINPLCLQAGSKLPGAYDARSLCHNVIVPFDMNVLEKALGGSNEPFLNKPARFPELSKSNAVRAGNDKEILDTLCDRLPLIDNQEDAFEGLVYALQLLISRKNERRMYFQFKLDSLPSDAAKLYRYIDDLLRENYEGEILTLVIAGIFELFLCDEEDYEVEVHPVNQSGASSKEVSDLDVYKNGKLYVANELKDKPFVDTDIRHAADKVIEAGKSQLNFIVGRQGSCSQDMIDNCTQEYLHKNFVINVIAVDDFLLSLMTLIEKIDLDHFLKYLIEVGINTKFKEATVDFIRQKAKIHFGIE